MDALEVASKIMHDAYREAADTADRESLASWHGPWDEASDANKAAMRAAAAALFRFMEGQHTVTDGAGNVIRFIPAESAGMNEGGDVIPAESAGMDSYPQNLQV